MEEEILKYKYLLGALRFASTLICLYFAEIAAQDMQSKYSSLQSLSLLLI